MSQSAGGRRPTRTATSGGASKCAHSRVLDPSGALCHHWSAVVSLAFLYNFWSLSYRFAFQEIDHDSVALWFALDYSADLIYLLDVVINFRTGYLDEGVLERNLNKISKHYRECTTFYLDCFCLLPLDVLYLSLGFNSILRCTRLVKIYKFWAYVDRTERHTNYPNLFRTFTLVHYILVIFHWNACLFHMISKNKLIEIENLYRINDNRCNDVLCQYLYAFYWSTLALTTIGDLPRPRTKGEYLYVSCELFFGLFVFASVLGHVANIVTNVSAARKEFQAKLDAVKTFMRTRRVSDELQNKVVRWFDYLWISQKSSDEDKSVAWLPDRLKAEIAIQVHLDTLKRVDIFQNTEAGFLCELVLRLKPVLFSPGDYVCRKNEVGHEMYIVSRGTLEVVAEVEAEQSQVEPDTPRPRPTLTVVATLKAGSYFGEISVLNVGLAGNKRTASVRSVGYSDLFCLIKQDLWDVLKNYPAAERRIRARAEERLSKLDINQQGSSQHQELAKPTAAPEVGRSHPRGHVRALRSGSNSSGGPAATGSRTGRDSAAPPVVAARVRHRRDKRASRQLGCLRRHAAPACGLLHPQAPVYLEPPLSCCSTRFAGWRHPADCSFWLNAASSGRPARHWEPSVCDALRAKPARRSQRGSACSSNPATGEIVTPNHLAEFSSATSNSSPCPLEVQHNRWPLPGGSLAPLEVPVDVQPPDVQIGARQPELASHFHSARHNSPADSRQLEQRPEVEPTGARPARARRESAGQSVD